MYLRFFIVVLIASAIVYKVSGVQEAILVPFSDSFRDVEKPSSWVEMPGEGGNFMDDSDISDDIAPNAS